MKVDRFCTLSKIHCLCVRMYEGKAANLRSTLVIESKIKRTAPFAKAFKLKHTTIILHLVSYGCDSTPRSDPQTVK